MKSKKSQVKMTETVGILVIFFILILFGLIFYSNYQKTALLKEKDKILEKDAVTISLKASYFPEFACEQTLNIKSGTCIDVFKLTGFNQLIDENQTMKNYYSSIFLTSDIYLVDLIENKTYSVYNNTKEEFTKKTVIRTPIILRNSYSSEESFGVLHVDYYN